MNRFVEWVLAAGVMGGAVAGAQQQAQQQPWSVRAANAAMQKWPNGAPSPSSSAAPQLGRGLLLEGIEAVWRNTVDRRDYLYIQHAVDPLIGSDGSLTAVKSSDSHIANLELGRPLMLLYGVTLKKRYYDAATALYQQIESESLANAHSPAAEPFVDAYALKFHHPEVFAQTARQFATLQKLELGDQASQIRMQLPGQNRIQSMAVYVTALVDTIPSMEDDSAARSELIALLNEEAKEVSDDQDARTGLWSDKVALPGAAKLPPDATSSCLFIYALAKGVRLGYLPESYGAAAERAYQGVLSHFVTGGADGSFALHGTADSPLETGAFLLASTEIENLKNAKIGRGDNVMVDGWFNSQQMKDVTGHEIYFHYKWNEQSNPGYSLWGHAFRNFGARTTTLYAEPTLKNLQPAQVYIIASPDNLDKNPNAHFANATDAKEIAKWVKAGGVLAIMENDTSFADLDHFNVVAEKFGMHFNSVLRMHVVGTDWSMGRLQLDGKGPIFHHPHAVYVKDVCTISVKPPAVPVYKHEKDIFMAVAKYGKGTVYAMVDPWFYNEYTNGLKLPAEYENYAAGVELAKWLLEQVPKREGSGVRVQGAVNAASRP